MMRSWSGGWRKVLKSLPRNLHFLHLQQKLHFRTLFQITTSMALLVVILLTDLQMLKPLILQSLVRGCHRYHLPRTNSQRVGGWLLDQGDLFSYFPWFLSVSAGCNIFLCVDTLTLLTRAVVQVPLEVQHHLANQQLHHWVHCLAQNSSCLLPLLLLQNRWLTQKWMKQLIRISHCPHQRWRQHLVHRHHQPQYNRPFSGIQVWTISWPPLIVLAALCRGQELLPGVGHTQTSSTALLFQDHLMDRWCSHHWCLAEDLHTAAPVATRQLNSVVWVRIFTR